MNSLAYLPISKAITLGQDVWKKAVALVDQAGYRPTSFGGLDRVSTREFARLLRQSISREKLDVAGAKELTGLLAFFDGPGAGGFGLSRGFPKWNRC